MNLYYKSSCSFMNRHPFFPIFGYCWMDEGPQLVILPWAPISVSQSLLWPMYLLLLLHALLKRFFTYSLFFMVLLCTLPLQESIFNPAFLYDFESSGIRMHSTPLRSSETFNWDTLHINVRGFASLFGYSQNSRASSFKCIFTRGEDLHSANMF